MPPPTPLLSLLNQTTIPTTTTIMATTTATMATLLRLLLLLLLLFSTRFLSVASTNDGCSDLLTFPSTETPLSNCTSLSTLSASLRWAFNSSTVDVAFRSPLPSSGGWVAWGLNPKSQGMVGTQALIATLFANNSISSFTSPIKASYHSGETPLKPGKLSYEVAGLQAVYRHGLLTIYATLHLPSPNGAIFSHTWQASSILRDDLPGPHPLSGDHVRSFSTLNFLSGESSSLTSDANSRLHRKHIHGVLNAVSWGMLMPIGGIIARYLRVFQSADPAWFHLHVSCQSSAYALGVAGWGIGLKLGADSPGLPHRNRIHRAIGIILFCLATLQVLALLLRPHKEHKRRCYWNIYHHTIGYAVIALSVVNMWEGFALLNAESKWKRAYFSVIVSIGGVALLLESFTWIVVLRRWWKSAHKKPADNGLATTGRIT